MVGYQPVSNQQKHLEQQQQQPLLYNNKNNTNDNNYIDDDDSSATTNEDDDDDDDDDDGIYSRGSNNQNQTTNSSTFILINKNHSNNNNSNNGVNHHNNSNNHHNRKRFNIRRKARRFTRFIIISLAVLIILLLIYIPIFNSVHSRLVAIPGWSYNTSRNISDYILPNEHTTLLEPRNFCHKNFFLLIVVCSSVENFAMRQTIRETWGNVTEFNYPTFKRIHSHLIGQFLDIRELSLRMYADHLNLINISTNLNESMHNQKFPVRIVFLTGMSDKNSINYNETLAKLKLESEQYDDLIQENFLDTYNNLTIKSVMMLKWIINNNCLTRGKFLMKCDDDTFVNIANLLHILLGGTIPVYNSTIEFYDPFTVNALSPSNRMTLTHNVLIGYLFCMVKPISDISSKWYSPLYMYNGDIYPNYLSGSSYLMSFDVIQKLYNASLNTLLLHLEDVYLTGICSEKIHLKRRHHPLFSFNHKQNKCTYKGTITQHYIKGDQMHDIYDFVMNDTIHCPSPEKYFKVKRLRKRLKSCH